MHWLVLSPLVLAFQFPLPSLRPGEAWHELAGLTNDASAKLEFLRSARVLDSTTSAPIRGVEVEAWTESLEGEAVIVDRTTTRRDGSFAVLSQSDGHRAEKIRLRAAGYRTTVDAMPSDPELFLCPTGPAVTLRVLDLDRNPVAGARVRTHQTCSHAPPAAVGVTDAKGFVELLAPPLFDGADFELVAPGHAALQYLSHEQLLAAYPAAAEIFVPRRKPVRLRVLDADGRPLAKQRIVQGGSPEWQAMWTDGDGRVEIPSMFGDRDVYATIAGPRGTERFLGEGRAPQEGEWTLREGGDKPPRDLLPNQVATLVLEPAAGADPDRANAVRVLHQNGWTAEGLGEHELPPGHCVLMIGAAFSGVEERLVPCELRAGERLVVPIDPQAEPELTVSTEIDTAGILHVQAGDDSVSREFTGPGEVKCFVPRGKRVVVLIQGELARRIELAPMTGARNVRLEDMEVVRSPDHRDAKRTSVRLRAVDSADQPLAVGGRLVCAFPGIPGSETESGTIACDLPEGAPFEARFGAEGYVTRWVVGLASATPAKVTLSRRASLEIRGPFVGGVAGGEEAARDKPGTLSWSALAPGPLDVIATRADGSRLALELQLVEGEVRILALD